MIQYLLNLLNNPFITMFLICLLGYILGSIKFFNISLGSSGILLIALVFGHFGFSTLDVIRNLGLIMFVTSIGYLAGPEFIRLFKSKALSFVFLGITVVTIGALLCALVIIFGNVPADLAIGMFTGALTSTPGLAAATELLGDMAATGYGIAYPFGVLGVVIFVQLAFKLSKNDHNNESNLNLSDNDPTYKTKKYIVIEKTGFFALALAIVFGVIVANIKIPLGSNIFFSLGTSGGPLLVGLLFGHFQHLGPISLTCSKSTLSTIKELGLILFLIGAGTQAGAGFWEILSMYGIKLFIFGALITIIPMLLGYLVAKYVFKLSLFDNLGAITGGMTSTPALGALIAVANTDSVAASYAATYPIALTMVVLITQVLALIFM